MSDTALKTLTVRILREHGACPEWLGKFAEAYPNGFTPTREALLEALRTEFRKVFHWLVKTGVLARLDLSGADLREADLRGAKLSEADLSEADLRGADLCWADLREADLRGAYLCWADLREADLREAKLSEADLSWAKLSNTRGIDAAARAAQSEEAAKQ